MEMLGLSSIGLAWGQHSRTDPLETELVYDLERGLADEVTAETPLGNPIVSGVRCVLRNRFDIAAKCH